MEKIPGWGLNVKSLDSTANTLLPLPSTTSRY